MHHLLSNVKFRELNPAIRGSFMVHFITKVYCPARSITETNC